MCIHYFVAVCFFPELHFDQPDQKTQSKSRLHSLGAQRDPLRSILALNHFTSKALLGHSWIKFGGLACCQETHMHRIVVTTLGLSEVLYMLKIIHYF